MFEGTSTAVIGSALTFALSATNCGVQLSLTEKLEQNYEVWLSFFLEGFGVNENEVGGSTFSKEERIFRECEDVRLQTMSINQVLLNWDKLFKRGSRLVSLPENQRRQAILRLQSVWCHYKLRLLLSKNFTLGVIGESKAGKSTLCQKMFGVGKPSMLKRTADLCVFNPTENFSFIDFPHSDGVTDIYKDCFYCGNKLLDAIIIVLDGPKSLDDIVKQQRTIVNLASDLEIPMFVCLNKVDCFFDEEEFTPLQLQEWRTKAAKNLKVDVERVRYTSFKQNNISYYSDFKKEIYTVQDIKDWIFETIGDALSDAEKLAIKNYNPASNLGMSKRKEQYDLLVNQFMGMGMDEAKAIEMAKECVKLSKRAKDEE